MKKLTTSRSSLKRRGIPPQDILKYHLQLVGSAVRESGGRGHLPPEKMRVFKKFLQIIRKINSLFQELDLDETGTEHLWMKSTSRLEQPFARGKL